MKLHKVTVEVKKIWRVTLPATGKSKADIIKWMKENREWEEYIEEPIEINDIVDIVSCNEVKHPSELLDIDGAEDCLGFQEANLLNHRKQEVIVSWVTKVKKW